MKRKKAEERPKKMTSPLFYLEKVLSSFPLPSPSPTSLF